MFTFSTNVPQADQKISATQAPIQSNFQAISALININHFGFNDPINYGKHSYTSLPFQVSDPTTLAGEMAVYCKQTGSPNAAEIFCRYPSNGTVIQITGGGASGGVGASTPGFVFVSSTVFFMWGLATGIVNGNNTITFPSGGSFPTFSSVYQVNFTAAVSYTNLTTTFPYTHNVTTSSFDLNVSDINYATSIYWLALGSL